MVVSRFEVDLVRLDPTEGSKIEKTRLVKKLGKIGDATSEKVLRLLAEMFAP